MKKEERFKEEVHFTTRGNYAGLSFGVWFDPTWTFRHYWTKDLLFWAGNHLYDYDPLICRTGNGEAEVQMQLFKSE